MRKTRYKRTIHFRVTDALSAMLMGLSEQTDKTESDLIREAVLAYCNRYQNKPGEIRKVA